MVAFARAGGFGDDPVAGAKGVMKVGVLASSIGAVQCNVTELLRGIQLMEAVSGIPEEAAKQFAENLGGHLSRLVGDDERPGALSAAVDSVFAENVGSTTAAITPIRESLMGADPSALPQLLEARLSETMAREAGKAVARLFDADGGSPLMTHLTNGERAIAALRQEQTAFKDQVTALFADLSEKVVVQQAHKPTPIQAGNTWESDSLDDIAGATAIFGDTVEWVGASAGHGGSKAGDHILHVCDDVSNGIRVAVECRTGSSRPLTVDLLRKMVDNRDAHAGLLLAKTAEALPRDAQAGGFRIYFAERLVVLHHDRSGPGADQRLGVAIQVARLLGKLAATSNGSLDERDQVRDHLNRIESALGHLKPLRAAVTGIQNETGKVQQHASALEAEIRRALARSSPW